MIIRDVYYNLTSVHYTVLYKTRNIKQVRYTFLTYTCVYLIVIVKRYIKFGHEFSQYYRIPIVSIKDYLNSN